MFENVWNLIGILTAYDYHSAKMLFSYQSLKALQHILTTSFNKCCFSLLFLYCFTIVFAIFCIFFHKVLFDMQELISICGGFSSHLARNNFYNCQNSFSRQFFTIYPIQYHKSNCILSQENLTKPSKIMALYFGLFSFSKIFLKSTKYSICTFTPTFIFQHSL